MKSRIVMQNGKTEIEVEGKVITTAAYVTYFTENNDYQGFTEAGYDLYSICTYFTSLPINEGSGFTPARIGIFDTKGVEDFSELDKDMADLLAINKNAMVFPRIYVSMPLWWLRENPSECVPVDTLKEGREMLFSEKFRHDSGEMLKKFIAHCQNAPYANSIIGYQISGGSTQEWFHFGQRGSYCENAYAYFIGFMEKNHPEAKATRDDFFPENEKVLGCGVTGFLAVI